MEFLNPCYLILIQIRQHISSGHSVDSAIKAQLVDPRDPFSTALAKWWNARVRGAQWRVEEQFPNLYQRSFVKTLERGMLGEPILDRLIEIEEEMRLSMVDSIERHLQMLPVLMVLPLTLFIFPAFMLQILGPLLNELMRSLN